MNEIKIVRSRRKTLGLEVKNGQVLVRAPFWCTDGEIRRFVTEHSRWIVQHLKKEQAAQAAAGEEGALSPEDIRRLAREAKKVIPERVSYFAPLIGVTYGKIFIRSQHTRWGSCSSKGNLNFNCLLMLTPPQVLDSVVVHELCHRKEMNHSARFYREVLRVFPEYFKWHNWLKVHGPVLMKRMENGAAD